MLLACALLLTCSIADDAEKDGTCTPLHSCGTFACNRGSSTLMCFTKCTTAEECAPGNACDAHHACVPLRNGYVDEACALSPAGPERSRRPVEAIVVLLAAVAVVCRRGVGRGR